MIIRIIAVVFALLTLTAGSMAQSLSSSAGRMHFTLSPGYTVKLTADGVAIIRGSHIYLVTPGWTGTLLNADNITPTVTQSITNGVSTGTAVYETTDAKVTYTYQLGPDETYKVTVNYASTGKPAEVEWDMAYLHANLIAGRAWFGETGSQVARFKITYSDGIFYEIRILYGTQICDFNDLRGGLQTTSVWKGTDSVGQNVAVRRWAWKTPRPDMPIQSETLTSDDTEAAPVFLGLTAVVGPMYTMPEAIRTLSIAGGLTGSTTADLNRLNVVPDAPARNAVNLADASRMARIVAGLDY